MMRMLYLPAARGEKRKSGRQCCLRRFRPMQDLTPSATRRLSTNEQVRVLRNHIAFLEEDIADMERQVDLLVQDNAEIDFLAGVNERMRSAAVTDLYASNVRRIEKLRREIEGARNDIRTYRRVLEERFGVVAP